MSTTAHRYLPARIRITEIVSADCARRSSPPFLRQAPERVRRAYRFSIVGLQCRFRRKSDGGKRRRSVFARALPSRGCVRIREERKSAATLCLARSRRSSQRRLDLLRIWVFSTASKSAATAAMIAGLLSVVVAWKDESQARCGHHRLRFERQKGESSQTHYAYPGRSVARAMKSSSQSSTSPTKMSMTSRPRAIRFSTNNVVVHNCFIQTVSDDLVNEGGIMDLWVREARIFKYGSGTGSNFSKIRGEGEKLSGGGTRSGLMSFLKRRRPRCRCDQVRRHDASRREDGRARSRSSRHRGVRRAGR